MDLCWFCEKNPTEELLEVTIALRTAYAVGLEKHTKVESAKVPIPRCSKCRTIHRWARDVLGGYMIAGTLAGLVVVISLAAIFSKELTALKDNSVLLVLAILLVLVPFAILMLLAWFVYENKTKKKYFEELRGKSKIKLDNMEAIIKHPAVDAWRKILKPGRASSLQIYWKK
jgi:hypothetical protein